MTDYLFLSWNVIKPDSIVNSQFEGSSGCEFGITTDDFFLNNFTIEQASSQYELLSSKGIQYIWYLPTGAVQKKVLINILLVLPETPPFTTSTVEVGIVAWNNINPNCVALSPLKFVQTFFSCPGSSDPTCNLLYGLAVINLDNQVNPDTGPASGRRWSIFIRPSFPLPKSNLTANISFTPYD